MSLCTLAALFLKTMVKVISQFFPNWFLWFVWALCHCKFKHSLFIYWRSYMDAFSAYVLFVCHIFMCSSLQLRSVRPNLLSVDLVLINNISGCVNFLILTLQLICLCLYGLILHGWPCWLSKTWLVIKVPCLTTRNFRVHQWNYTWD